MLYKNPSLLMETKKLIYISNHLEKDYVGVILAVIMAFAMKKETISIVTANLAGQAIPVILKVSKGFFLLRIVR